ncbi:MAG: SRPBCC family protein [Spirochaetes bacterium]|nr:SRPBCC family protein [Spirochaetota bacterium]
MKIEKFDAAVEIAPPEPGDTGMFLDRAYKYLGDITSFPSYMQNVTRITEEKSSDETYHHWEILVDDAEFQWKQKTVHDAENRAIQFTMVDGDFEKLEGAWTVATDGSRHSLQLQMTYSIGLPVLEDVLGPVLKEKLQSNVYDMLNSIKERLEVDQ